MTYPLLAELEALVVEKLVSKRPHPTLPLFIYNYSATAQFKPIAEWTEALCDARGLILDHQGNVIGRPFRKFWNYEQVLDRIPAGENFQVWEKLDGSLGIVCFYRGQRVVSSRGSFESDQARWANAFMEANHADFQPARERMTYLFEIVYPANRIVVDYGSRAELILLAVMDNIGFDLDGAFEDEARFPKARRFDGLTDFSIVNTDPLFQGQEGFVVRWESGMRAKIKADEYKRLHRLITRCSTRTIWELLRTGKGVSEVIERVPAEFQEWVNAQTTELNGAFERISLAAMNAFNETPGRYPTRKDFAEWAKTQPNPSLLFSLLDGRDISDSVWKLVEPRWASPFRKEPE